VTDGGRTIEGEALRAMRAQGRTERAAGFVACLVGVAMLALARGHLGAEPWLVWGGISVIGLGWALLIISLARRLIWLRAHKDELQG
jgi:hypothetical protein